MLKAEIMQTVKPTYLVDELRTVITKAGVENVLKNVALAIKDGSIKRKAGL